jgi:hypothetical protein
MGSAFCISGNTPVVPPVISPLQGQLQLHSPSQFELLHVSHGVLLHSAASVRTLAVFSVVFFSSDLIIFVSILFSFLLNKFLSNSRAIFIAQYHYKSKI